ncbi:phosphoribosylformylglycinamidine synthase [Anaerobacterium chartisolvens]|uniref:Phosphoribosylformylglycinamidine synthase n=1 Tax=Anaerobacterium chartisolvens TaxID=1297424 RepID=A0A369B9A1_9FIRM|nr:phosphoribosylformylglycinamidine synthase [Anaerobacterium chartisolvens]RCX17136.1 phosphoribosylformylglycinamidine synthase [Anaerobacterium chartisolvens]
MSSVRRIFVEKKKGFDIEAQGLYRDLKFNLGVGGLEAVRIVNRYDIEGISEEEYIKSKNTIFSEPPVDVVFDESFELQGEARLIAIEYLPGQYDQRADSASQCIQILTGGERPSSRVAKLIIVQGNISEDDYNKIKNYCINPVECQEAQTDKPLTLDMEVKLPPDVKVLEGFTAMPEEKLELMMKDMGFAMSLEDLMFCRDYFKNTERRDPTVTELRLIDTYWSDHCRHTTFLTNIDNVKIEDGYYSDFIASVYQGYSESRKYVYGEKQKDMCLMDIATIAMKELKKRGRLHDLDESDEINACSITASVDVDGRTEEWLVMFKNETHNHPTEIEPFGGAATCLGGAIRDPLSGRSYVYQAMRVTGSGDPRTGIRDTIPGKLPQRKITTGAAAGYSSYGNQIGLATGQVAEVYDEGFVAKRMEIGAVIGAAPRRNVVRQAPCPGDVVILLGGRTGRDGCGGATGSSKEHTEESLLNCGAEVQKGNPPTERKIQRLFRNADVSRMIKRCNDFGAGGVSVAIGELADSLEINLDAVPKKYEGLDGTELAISESQERMAVVVDAGNVQKFIGCAGEENLEAVAVAVVTDDGRLKMVWRGSTIVNIGREFLNTNGVRQNASAVITIPDRDKSFFKQDCAFEGDLKDAWIKNLQNLNVCSQKGLAERFDSTIGASTVLMPFGGKHQLSPAEGMVAKLPVRDGETVTGTAMAYGYNSSIARWSPFHGAIYAVVESVAKIVAMGGDYKSVRLTLQEYFEKLGKDPEKWGKPISALLGAYYAQMKLGIPAIGGKDSMSGTFKDMSVPPTLVSFAVDMVDVRNVVSTEFKKAGSKVVLVPLIRDRYDIPDFERLDAGYALIHRLISSGKVLAAHTIKAGGLSEAISKMCFGNMIGFAFTDEIKPQELFMPDYGSILLEIPENEDISALFGDISYREVGVTKPDADIEAGGVRIALEAAAAKWQEPLEEIFPTAAETESKAAQQYSFDNFKAGKRTASPIARPRVFMPVFPGTNCEYDTERAFKNAGAEVDVFVIRNMSSKDIEESVRIMADKIKRSQIIMLPGGFSGGDEPDGSGKFIATAFRNEYVKEAVNELLKHRDGLMLGICNGFQALIKLGLVPYGEIRDIDEACPTLTFNTIGRHVSCMVMTKAVSRLSPWMSNVSIGDIHTVPVSHGEGRFAANAEVFALLEKNGQIATQYVDLEGRATYDIRYNPNGSFEAVEGITSPDGRVFGKMAHSERIGSNIAKNIPGEKDQRIFEAGVNYFK